MQHTKKLVFAIVMMALVLSAFAPTGAALASATSSANNANDPYYMQFLVTSNFVRAKIFKDNAEGPQAMRVNNWKIVATVNSAPYKNIQIQSGCTNGSTSCQFYVVPIRKPGRYCVTVTGTLAINGKKYSKMTCYNF